MHANGRIETRSNVDVLRPRTQLNFVIFAPFLYIQGFFHE